MRGLPMATRRLRGLSGVACAAVLLLAACAHEGQDQMSWARAALERNSQLEVVAADPQSHTFTVRVKESGELRVVRADQVMAEPLVSGPAAAAAAPPAVAPAAPPPRVAPAAPRAPRRMTRTTAAPAPPRRPADGAPAAAEESLDARTAA